jgi:pSer/pThr/pTyr-binding forkhead associated (FHA) protein
VVIDSRAVSRRHAEVFRTAAQEWMIKDLGSTNGTFVNGRRVQSCPLAAEDVVGIGPVTLRLAGRSGEPAPAGVEPQPPRILVEDFGTEVFYDRPRLGECVAPPYPKRLDLVKKRLSELTDPRALRWEVCRALAQGPGTASAIFRVPPRGSPLSGTPDILAYHFGDRGEDT